MCLRIILLEEDYREKMPVTGFGFHMKTFILCLGTMKRQNLAPIYKKHNEVKTIASQNQLKNPTF